jgi:hypothetical protein
MVRKIIVPSIVMLVATVGMAWISQLNPILLIDLPTFIAVPLLSCLYVIASYGFKAFGRSFSTACQKEPPTAEVEKSKDVLGSLGAALWLTAIMALTISLLALLANLDDLSIVGPNLAVCFLSILYAAFCNLVLLKPFQMALKQK